MSPDVPHIPRATYRLQLRDGFGFDEAAAIVPYLAALGITHLYCSPYLQARRGSTHGYDVVDHARVSDDLGGASAHQRMIEALDKAGLGHILDIVPNHMAINDRRNWLWWDVLKRGHESPYASFFDIDWDPSEAKLHHRVLVPILDDHYGRVLEAGAVMLVRSDGELVVKYRESELPLSTASAAGLTNEGVAAVNGNPDAMHELLDVQHYRLAYWRSAGEDLNYRRFFAVNDLVALRMESPAVFAVAHQLVLKLLEAGRLQGLRVDHIDGLRRPQEYLESLRAAAPGAYLVVEKILEDGEDLPSEWPVQGTTGYDWLNWIGGLFIDSAAQDSLTELYAKFTGNKETLENQARAMKLQLIFTELASDLERLCEIFAEICERHRRYRDYTRRQLRRALAELIAAFSVYRTYVNPVTGEVSDQDRDRVESAVAAARGRRDDIDDELLDFLQGLLLLEYEGPLEHNLATRFQQITGPAMAKGIEDTFFYGYNRFVVLNEVGGDPGTFGLTSARFHDAARAAQVKRPSSLIATSTHDSKRSEDVRARLSVLSEMPDEWAAAVTRWANLNDKHRSVGMPDRNMEYLLYQTLVGAWPLDMERACAYMEKASKEAKVHTSWIDPNVAYDEALRSFTRALLEDGAFCAELDAFASRLVEPGRVVSLAQTLLKLTVPGVPDIYQGTELWDLSLVDPDNRRPVDYSSRHRLLRQVSDASPEDVLAREDEGAPKLFLIHKALQLRAQRPHAFGQESDYEPLELEGARADHAVAFTRAGEVAVLVPRLVLRMGDRWDDTMVRLPEERWRDALTGEQTTGGEVPVAQLLGRFPVALLVAQDA